MTEEATSIEDIIDFHTFTTKNLLEIIYLEFGEDAESVLKIGKKYWKDTYDIHKGKCLPESLIDVYAFSVANAKLREFYTKVKKGFDYIGD